MSDDATDERPAAPVDPRRRSFGPVVLAGLATATLAAVAAHKPWIGLSTDDKRAQAMASAATTSGSGVTEFPAAGALALVCLAAWGVLLVTRGRFRRAVAVLGVLASVGLLTAVVVGYGSVADQLRRAVGEVGAPATVGHTAWFWITALSAVGCVATLLLAVRLTPSWPEMGTRYDAPVGGGAGAGAAAPVTAPVVPVEEQTNLDLWKSIDEGRDPTA